MDGKIIVQPPLTKDSVPPTPLQSSTQPAKQGLDNPAKSQKFRLFSPVQFTGGVSSSNGASSSATRATPKYMGAPQISGPHDWGKKVTANGEVSYVNHRTKTTLLNPPLSAQTAATSPQRTANASDIYKKSIASRTDSESEDVLQEFRLPQIKAIKFEVDGSPRETTPSKKTTHTTHKFEHQKKPSYDHTDVERVKTIFSSSPRPNSSSGTRPDAPQPHNVAGRQRQSQRETKVPERLVTGKPPQAKPISLPSRTTTPKTESRRRAQTPPRSQISVIIPTSQQKPKQSAVDLEEDRAKKQSLLQEMKQDVTVIRRRAGSVENYFGTTGFSAIYDTRNDEQRLKKIHKLQPKARKVKRKDVKLDWGDDTSAAMKPFKHEKLVHPREQIKEITKSTVLSLNTGPPITFANNIDDRQLNGKFQFVSEYVIREGVRRQPAHFNVHVNCSSTCTGVCSPATCACVWNDKMEASNNAPVPTYRQRGDGLVVLTDTFIKLSKTDAARSEIVECNNNCHCDKGCFNRVVQQGRTLPLEIFMTKSCGFSLRCPRDVVKGQFIDVYLGELVTEATLIKREDAQDDGEPSYLFTLDWFNEKVPYVHYQIDGKTFGSSVRFVNHSCNANCGVFPVMLKEYDQNIYGLAVFALKDIPAMTELTLDYAPQLEGADAADFAKCQCGEKNCRGYLWPKPTRNARRRKAI